MKEMSAMDEMAAITQQVVAYFELVVGAAAIIPNVIVCMLGAKLSLHHNTQVVVLSMTIADLLFAALHCPLVFAQLAHGQKDEVTCIVLYMSTYVTSISSSLSCLILNIDRFLFIYRPLHYRAVVTYWRLVISVVLCWVVSALFGVLFLFGPATERGANCAIKPKQFYMYIVFLFTFFSLPILISFGISCYIMWLIRRFSLREHNERAILSRQSGEKVPKFKFKVSRSVIFVFSTTLWSLVTQIPYRTVYILAMTRAMDTDEVTYPIFMALFAMVALNSLGNPFITVFTQPIYSRSLKDIYTGRGMRSHSLTNVGDANEMSGNTNSVRWDEGKPRSHSSAMLHRLTIRRFRRSTQRKSVPSMPMNNFIPSTDTLDTVETVLLTHASHKNNTSVVTSPITDQYIDEEEEVENEKSVHQ